MKYKLYIAHMKTILELFSYFFWDFLGYHKKKTKKKLTLPKFRMCKVTTTKKKKHRRFTRIKTFKTIYKISIKISYV